MKCWIHDYINLLPIGNVSITKDKSLANENTIYFGAINKSNTKIIINPSNVEILRGKMLEMNTELLTNGHDFFLLDGNSVFEVAHPKFTEIYNDLGWNKINEMMIDSVNW